GYFAEVPTVLIDVQRTGPSTGMPTRTQQSDILLAAYASHGDTKHPLLFPASPKECFEMTAAAFDLTERLQTPVIVMTDLDLGMNDHITEPLVWDDTRRFDRGKVLTNEQLDHIAGGRTLLAAAADPSSTINGDADKSLRPPSSVADLPGHDGSSETAGEPLQQFRGKYGRYLDIDDDGIPYRTIPGTHTSYGAFVTRGSSRDEYAVYTEDGDAYRRNVDRLARKWDTAKELGPQPEFLQTENTRSDGVIFFGTSTYAAEEAIELLREDGIELDAMRVRAFPFGKVFREFVSSHKRLFVIEQNRDAQFRSLMMIELGVDPSKLISVLNYDGMPITADNILRQIKGGLQK
ncbi:MAG: hypothetical protein ABI878_15800, partial [Acidobacteriota bacterium]